MAADPSIIFQLGRGVTPLMSPGEIQDQQMQRELGGLKLNALRQAAQDDAAYRDVLRSGAPPEMIPNKLFQAGLGQQGQQWQKFQGDQRKTQMDAQKAQVEAALKKFELSGQIMNGVRDQASWDRARQQTEQVFGPEVASQLPAQYDPALIEENRAKAMSVKEQLEQKWKEMQYTTPDANARLSAETSRMNNQASISQSDINNQRSVGASLSNAAATRSIADATRDAADAKRAQDTEMKLADDYRAQSKDFKAVGDAYRQINATLDKASTSPAATLAAATKFMKLLDPGSVVRESELGMALQASGVIDRATNYFNVLQRGKVLTPTQVADFKNITKQIYSAAQEGQKAVDADYMQKAQQYGLRPEMIVQELGQTKKGAGSKQSDSKTFNIGGQSMQARRAPDGKYYVQQNGKWFEVKE